MTKYKVSILPSVIYKDLSRVPVKDSARIMARIKSLTDNPRPLWSKKLSGREEYRARCGHYRILYIIDDGVKIVNVTKVGHRKNNYN